MTRPSTRDLRARSVLAGEASAAAAALEAALETPPSSRTAAFFDVDNTMLPGASVCHGLTGGLETVAAQRDGLYTGELVGDILHGPAKAESAGWRIRDDRIGRTVARLGLLTAGASGITLGAVSAAMAVRQRVS
jgi:hypothetical protein